MRKQNNRFRRGIAMEMAIGLMLLTVALSIILYTISMLQIKNRQSDKEAFEEKVVKYQITDMILDGTITNEFSINEKNYIVKKSGNKYEIIGGDGTVVLTIVTDESDEIITSWQ